MRWLSVSNEKLVRHDTRCIVYYVRKQFKHISMYWLMVTPVKIIFRPSYALLSILIAHSFSIFPFCLVDEFLQCWVSKPKERHCWCVRLYEHIVYVLCGRALNLDAFCGSIFLFNRCSSAISYPCHTKSTFNLCFISIWCQELWHKIRPMRQ